jgi:uncharacterized Zn finger protein
MALTTMTQSNPLSQTLTKDLILRLAGDRYFERGVNYFRQGRVTEFEDFGDSVEAIVEGTEEYVVKLKAKSGGLEHDCNCPLGMDDEFCKHCVAVALAWLDALATAAPQKTGGASKPSNPAKITGEDIAAAIDAADKATLAKLLLEWAEDDAALKDKLTHMAARRKGPEAGMALAKKTLEKAIRIRGYVEYREMRRYAAKVETAIGAVEELLRSGQAVGVIDLCETGLRWLSTACEGVDDSDGYMTMLMERLQDIHLRACIEAKPPAVALARKLFQAEMSSSFNEWSDAAEKYAEVLGEEGLAAYRSLAEAAWAKVPVKTERSSDYGKESHYAITRIMKALARQSGNMEELVAVLERDLSHAYAYEQIAGIYREAGARDQALIWAERGMKAMPGYEGAGLRQFVAEEYRHSDRHADALRIVWIEYRDSPSLAGYKRLEEFARAAEDWEEWRGQALAHVRRTLAGNERKPGKANALVHNWSFQKRDHSLLVEIFLYEGKAEEAWAEAQTGGCGDSLWLRLAKLREKKHPADAKAIYLRLGEQEILRASGNYDAGVALLERAAATAQALGKSGEFETELDLLLKKHKAKRNLQKRAAERRPFLYLHDAAL